MTYSPQTWADSPSTASPITAARLNHIEAGITAEESARTSGDSTHAAAADPHPGYTTAAELATAIVGKVDASAMAAKIDKATLDANSVLYATSDDTPAALAMAASTILARLASGNIVAATPAQLKTLLGDRSARSTADQNIPGATLVDLTSLSVPVAVSEHLFFNAVVFYDSTVGNDFQLAVTVPAGATSLTWKGTGPSTANSNTGANDAVNDLMIATSGGNSNYGGCRAAGAARKAVGIQVSGIVINGATAGNIQIQGAKVSNTDATTPADDALVYTNSHIEARTAP